MPNIKKVARVSMTWAQLDATRDALDYFIASCETDPEGMGYSEEVMTRARKVANKLVDMAEERFKKPDAPGE